MMAKPVLVAFFVIAIVSVLVFTCRTHPGFPHQDAVLAPAWSAWSRADFDRAKIAAERLVEHQETSDAIALAERRRG